MRRADRRRVVRVSRSWIGTPYVDQASRRGVGADCLGLARGVWREVVGPEAVPVPPYSRDWGEVGTREVLVEAARALLIEIDREAIGPGALVIFRMRAGALAKHVGILVAPDRFVHARERLGVIEEPFTTAWRRRVACAFVFPARRI
ncbi:NlpC/P60 family protein [Roseovarius salis]|uniref:NlpC/P60 family protein n=1 Tax=Roseovarius salis TaxID=3376063 RepID=UPI0037C6CA49